MVPTFAWHVHHTVLYELLTDDGIKGRVQYIRTHKPKREQARRLRLLKAVKNNSLLFHLATARSFPLTAKVSGLIRRTITALHDVECPRCPWDGHTIFPKPKKRAK